MRKQRGTIAGREFGLSLLYVPCDSLTPDDICN